MRFSITLTIFTKFVFEKPSHGPTGYSTDIIRHLLSYKLKITTPFALASFSAYLNDIVNTRILCEKRDTNYIHTKRRLPYETGIGTRVQTYARAHANVHAHAHANAQAQNI